MSETKFTPSPWQMGAGVTVITQPKQSEDDFKIWEYWPICDASIGQKSREEKEANVALISAAPEMYEFGETTAEVLQILLERLGPNPAGLNAEIKRLAEERIAEWQKIEKKARGEE